LGRYMRTYSYLLTMTVTKVSIVLFTAILFLFVSSSIFFSYYQPFVEAISANESNRVLGGITSLLSSNPDIVVNGSHAPVFNESNSKPDVPAAQKGFLVDEEGNFRISYPSGWVKNNVPTSQFTGVFSTPIVSFFIPAAGLDTRAITNTGVMIAKYVMRNQSSSASLPSLSGYVKEEINALEGNAYFELNESSPTTLGGNIAAHTIVYTATISDFSTLAVDQEKTMETIAIKDGIAYFIVYRENPESYPTYLPLVKKMIDSFEFK
jgi:hypothetical protein